MSACSNVALAADDVAHDGLALVGHRRRTAPSPSSSPRKPRLPCCSLHALTSSGPRSSGRRGRSSSSCSTTSAWRSPRSDWKTGSPSQSSSSQRSASKICSTFSGVERSRSVSSMRSTNSPAVAAARAASCTVPSARRRCAARRSAKERSARACWTQHATKPGRPDPMLIGAHVSPAGGPAKAVERGVERGCDAIQFFNQSPRAWRPRDVRRRGGRRLPRGDRGLAVDALLIHAVYLLNCASEDPEIRDKSLTALTALAAGGRRARRARRRAAPRLGAEGRRRRGDRARRRGDRRGARRVRDAARCTSRTPPAPAARSAARSRSWRG